MKQRTLTTFEQGQLISKVQISVFEKIEKEIRKLKQIRFGDTISIKYEVKVE